MVSTAWMDPMIPGEHAQHAGLRARRCQLCRRRLGDEAAVARTVVGVEDRGLPLEAEDGAVDHGDPLQQRGVIHEVAGREVVGPVDDGVVPLPMMSRMLSVLSRTS